MDEALISAEHGQLLLKVAAESVAYGLRNGDKLDVSLKEHPPELRVLRATFVTLFVRTEFQGCIGILRALRPLVMDVASNAFSAAFDDPRGSRISECDLRHLDIKISVLSEPQIVTASSENELVSKLRPGLDGLILDDNGMSGTLLPSVWESLPDPRDFVRHVKVKAGWHEEYWSSTLKCRRYTTQLITQ